MDGKNISRTTEPGAIVRAQFMQFMSESGTSKYTLATISGYERASLSNWLNHGGSLTTKTLDRLAVAANHIARKQLVKINPQLLVTILRKYAKRAKLDSEFVEMFAGTANEAGTDLSMTDLNKLAAVIYNPASVSQ